jgi:tyrosyl-tRNA synthetase
MTKKITIDYSEESVNRFFDRKLNTVYPSPEKFKELLMSGKRLKFYMGADPTGPRLHIGHLLGILKMSELQKLGHEIIFLIGDFTGRIGDPTDKSAARVALSESDINKNAALFKSQIERFIDFNSTNNPAKIVFNSEWNSKLSFGDVINLSANFTVQQMLERDMFENRLKNNKPIYLHEFLYPLMQGYDSVYLEVDGEFGGSDQTFNMLAGRTLEKIYLNKEKFVIVTNLLLSSDGINKMSKSIGNCIFLEDTPNDKYGKIMSLPDSLIAHYYELISNISDDGLVKLKIELSKNDCNPMIYKKNLAYEVVKIFDGEDMAEIAKKHFESTVQNKEIPTNIPQINKETILQNSSLGDKILLSELIFILNLTKSKAESKRMISAGAVSIDDNKITDINFLADIKSIRYLKVGKRNWLELI